MGRGDRMGEDGEEGCEEDAALVLNVDGWVKNRQKNRGEGHVQRCGFDRGLLEELRGRESSWTAGCNRRSSKREKLIVKGSAELQLYTLSRHWEGSLWV